MGPMGPIGMGIATPVLWEREWECECGDGNGRE